MQQIEVLREKLRKTKTSVKIREPSKGIMEIKKPEEVRDALLNFKNRIVKESKEWGGKIPEQLLVDVIHVMEQVGKLSKDADENIVDKIEDFQRIITDFTIPNLDPITHNNLVGEFLKAASKQVGGGQSLAPSHTAGVAKQLNAVFKETFLKLAEPVVNATDMYGKLQDLNNLAEKLGATKELNELTEKRDKKRAKQAIQEISVDHTKEAKSTLIAHWMDHFFAGKSLGELREMIKDIVPPALVDSAKKRIEERRKVHSIPEELKAAAGEKYGGLLLKLPRSTLFELLFAFREKPEGIKKAFEEFEKSGEELTSFKLRKKVHEISPLSALATKLYTLFTDRMVLQATTKDDYNSETDGVYPDYRKFVLNEIEKETSKQDALKKLEEGISYLLTKGTTYWQGIGYLTWLEGIPEEERKQRLAKWINGTYELPIQTDSTTAEKLIDEGGKRYIGFETDKLVTERTRAKGLEYIMLPIDKWIPAFVHEVGRKIEGEPTSITKEELETFFGEGVDDDVHDWVNKNKEIFEEYKNKVETGNRTKRQIHGDIKRRAKKKT